MSKQNNVKKITEGLPVSKSLSGCFYNILLFIRIFLAVNFLTKPFLCAMNNTCCLYYLCCKGKIMQLNIG